MMNTHMPPDPVTTTGGRTIQPAAVAEIAEVYEIPAHELRRFLAGTDTPNAFSTAVAICEHFDLGGAHWAIRAYIKMHDQDTTE